MYDMHLMKITDRVTVL